MDFEYSYIPSSGTELNALIDSLAEESVTPVYLDIETTTLNEYTGIIVLIQVYYNSRIYVVNAIDSAHDDLKRLVRALSYHTCIGHNIKFELKYLLEKFGILVLSVYDTQTIEAVLRAGVGKSLYSLAELVERHCEQFIDKSARDEFINFDGVVTESQIQYGAYDVYFLPEIQDKQLELLEKENLLNTADVENKLVPVLASMEHEGICLNTNAWLKLENIAKEEQQRLEQSLKEELVDISMQHAKEYKNLLELLDVLKVPHKKSKRGLAVLESITDVTQSREWLLENFNLGSPYQIKSVLNNFVLPLYTKDKLKNTVEKTLNPYVYIPIIDKLLSLREVEKRISTYGSGFLKDFNAKTKKIHTQYIGVGTATGRLSSSNPNMQNVPVYPEGYRQCFYCEEDYEFLAIDYSQQELRILGAIAKEPKFIHAYRNGLDIHTVTASVLFEKELKDVTKDERRIAKGTNFAMIYGSTARGLAYNLKIPQKMADEVMDSFFKKYTYIAKFLELAKKMVLKTKYSVTLAGRKRYFDDRIIFADNWEIKNYITKLEREGANHIIQGTGADVTKIAMIDLFYNNPFGDKFKLVLQIHDEIMAKVHKSIKLEAQKFMEETMLKAEQKFLGDILPAGVDSHFSTIWEKA